MVPWAPLFCTVLALAPMWRCWCSPSRVLWFRARQHRIGTSVRHRLRHDGLRGTKRGERAPAKLRRRHLGPKLANGPLGSALQHRAGAGSAVTLLVVAVACAVVSRAPTPLERECATACATLG